MTISSHHGEDGLDPGMEYDHKVAGLQTREAFLEDKEQRCTAAVYKISQPGKKLLFQAHYCMTPILIRRAFATVSLSLPKASSSSLQMALSRPVC